MYLRGMERRWHFLLERSLTPAEEAALSESLHAALQGWRSHGRPIAFRIAFPYHHFIEVIAQGPISGCATDTLWRLVRETVHRQGLRLLPTEWVAIQDEGNIFLKNFSEIKKIYLTGAWPSSWRVIEAQEGGLRCVSLRESALAAPLRLLCESPS
ncbi:MAG: hypothetical protein KatS3mg026_1700 [Bacteroidia bacterium]|nr:MAG: hypothetical protein KatS3mg026_1700 [Bacteroidia bacterium]